MSQSGQACVNLAVCGNAQIGIENEILLSTPLETTTAPAPTSCGMVTRRPASLPARARRLSLFGWALVRPEGSI